METQPLAIQPNAVSAFSGLSLDTKTKMALGEAAYTDLAGLNRIKQLGSKDQSAALKELSKQFESIFIHLMLKSMRDANEVFAEDNMFNSSEMEFHRDMLDNQLALNLSQGAGIGLAEGFYRQMLIQFDIDEAERTESISPAQGLALTFTRKPSLPPALITQPKASPSFDDQHSFVEHIYPLANVAAQQLGVAPQVLVAQAALETGWGKYVASDPRGNSSFNLFNIKADERWSGDAVSVSTVEYRHGVFNKEIANFRRYENFTDSFSDYVNFVKGEPRYQSALEQVSNSEAYVRALHQAGYATDPQYAEKVIKLINSDVIANTRAEDK